jgi:flagellar hook-length control protein FliK
LPSSTTSAQAVGGAQQTPQAIRLQVLNEISRQELRPGAETKLTLQLEPEQLGRVTVELRSHGGRLTVAFSAESAVAEDALREGGKELAQTLFERSAGRWGRIEVRLAERQDEQREDETAAGRDQTRRQRGQEGQTGREDQRSPRGEGG